MLRARVQFVKIMQLSIANVHLSCPKTVCLHSIFGTFQMRQKRFISSFLVQRVMDQLKTTAETCTQHASVYKLQTPTY